MRRRTAYADSPVDASSCSPPHAQPRTSSAPLQSSSSAASATAASQEHFQMRSVPAKSAVDHSAGLEMQTMHSPSSALQRPRSVAQKAGMNVWSRHAARYGSAPLSQTARLLSDCSQCLCYAPVHHARGQRPSLRSCWVTCLSCCCRSLTRSALICGKSMLDCCMMDTTLQAAPAAAGRLGGLSRRGRPAGAAPSARHLAPACPARRTFP